LREIRAEIASLRSKMRPRIRWPEEDRFARRYRRHAFFLSAYHETVERLNTRFAAEGMSGQNRLAFNAVENT